MYDGDAILLEYDGADALQARYAHGEETDQPLAMARDVDGSGQFEADEQYYYHTDHLGSVRLLTDNTGAVKNRYDYDAFGKWEATSYEQVANPYGYTARERDAESGLMFYRARYYDPEIGRFISEDPIGFDGDDLNLYRYVGNTPTVFTDSTGEMALVPLAILGASKTANYARTLLALAVNNAWGATVFYSVISSSGSYLAGFDECAGLSAGVTAGMAAGVITAGGGSGLSALGAALQSTLWGVAIYWGWAVGAAVADLIV